MKYKVLNDFVLEERVTQDVLDGYKGIIPNELLDVWTEYGFGSFMGGYLKIINPDQFQDIINGSYFRSNVAIPILATGMGDIIVWEENRYLRMINYRKGVFKGITAGFEFFFSDIESNSFRDKYLDWLPFPDAVEKFGKVNFDECFGYTPLLGLGGAEKVKNLKKVKIMEHIYLITELMGPID